MGNSDGQTVARPKLRTVAHGCSLNTFDLNCRIKIKEDYLPEDGTRS